MLTFLGFVILIFWIASLSNRLSILEKGKQKQASTSEPQSANNFAGSVSVPSASVNIPVASPQGIKTANNETATAADWLTKVGVLALIFGIGFFIKFAIDQGWISQWLRVVLGFAVGGLLCGLGTLWKEKFPKYAGALTGGGIAVMYFSAYAANAFYSLVPEAVSMVFLVAISGLGVYFAYSRKSVGLAGLAALGGYLAPVLLYGHSDQHIILFSYLSFLALAAVVISFYIYSSELLFLSFLGTVFDFLAWSVWFSSGSNTWPAVIFATVIFLLFILGGASAFRAAKHNNSLPQEAGKYFALLAVFLGIFYSSALTFFLYKNYHDYLAIMGLLGSVGAFLSFAIVDRLEFKGLNYCLSFVGTGLLALSCIWQFTGKTTDFMLIAFGVALVLAGVFLKRAELRVWGLMTLVAMVFAVLFTPYENSSYVFILNSKFGLVLAEVAALWFTGWLFGNVEITDQESQGAEVAHVVGSLLLWFGFSWELIQYYGNIQASENIKNLTLSMWWIGYATVLLVFGAAAKSGVYRKIAFALYVLAIIKVFLYDALNLETAYRIISFIVLGVILLIVSFSYQKNKQKITAFLEGEQEGKIIS